MEWKSIDLSSKLSLTFGGNLNYCKVVHHLIPTRGNREHPGNFQNKGSSPFSWVSNYIIFLTNWRGEEGLFWRVQEGGPDCEITIWVGEDLLVIKDEKSSLFVKIEIIPPLLCFLLDPLTNKHRRTCSSMICLWIDSRTSKESCCQQGKSLIIT